MHVPESHSSPNLIRDDSSLLLLLFFFLPLSTIIRGISFSAGEEHFIRFPSTKPFISARFSNVQLTPAESSGTLWASNTNCRKGKKSDTSRQI